MRQRDEAPNIVPRAFFEQRTVRQSKEAGNGQENQETGKKVIEEVKH